jgi:hypothetical protein
MDERDGNRSRQGRPTTPGAWWLGGAVGAAVVLVLVFVPSREVADGGVEDGEMVRSEPSSGTIPERAVQTEDVPLRVEVYVEADGQRRRVESGESLDAGALIGFRLITTEPGHVAVLTRGEGERVVVGFPRDAGGTLPLGTIPDGLEVEPAVVLDSRPGLERVVGLHCAEEHRIEPLIIGLVAIEPKDAQTPLPRVVPDCAQTEVVLVVRSDD